MRQAEKANTATEAKRLRAKAADMRRELREATKTKKPVVRKVARKKRSGAVRSILSNPAAIPMNTAAAIRAFPGKGNMTGFRGDNSTLHGVNVDMHARAIITEARKKNVDPMLALTERLEQIVRVAEFEGKKLAEKQAGENALAIRRATDAKIVCAFLAGVEHIETINHGMPTTFVVSGFTLSKIVDVLHSAGYTAIGNSDTLEARRKHMWEAIKQEADTNE